MDEQAVQTSVAHAPLVVARTFLAGLVSQDFARLGEALAPDVRLRVLLPGGPREWTGAAAVIERFARWFGDTTQFEPVESTAVEVGGRTRLRWRFRLQAERLGPGWFIVEQLAYGDGDERGQITHLDVLCSGYLAEGSDG